MTDAELEELGALLAKASTRPWRVDTADNIGKNWLICGGFGEDPDGSTPIITTDNLSGLQCVAGLASDDAKAMCAAVMAADRMISTIRELREENAARDRVVEAARATKADLLARANMAEADHVELGVGVWSELVDSLAALEEQS